MRKEHRSPYLTLRPLSVLSKGDDTRAIKSTFLFCYIKSLWGTVFVFISLLGQALKPDVDCTSIALWFRRLCLCLGNCFLGFSVFSNLQDHVALHLLQHFSQPRQERTTNQFCHLWHFMFKFIQLEYGFVFTEVLEIVLPPQLKI